MNSRVRLSFVAAVLAALSLAPFAAAQAQYFEGFNDTGTTYEYDGGPTNLVSAGWIFRNQSQPVGSGEWVGQQFCPLGLCAQEGEAYLRVTADLTTGLAGDVSGWALLPSIPNQAANDALSIYVGCNWQSQELDALEIRYSPTGGISTSSGPSGVGDFTIVLAEFNPLPSTSGWHLLSAVLPGPGRIALRYRVQDTCWYGCAESYLALDALTINAPPPCDMPPLPSPGETIVWSAAASPHHIECSDAVIPDGATVIIEAGATVNIAPDRALIVNGTLLAQGNQAAPVTLTGNDEFDAFAWVQVRGGTAEFNHTVINCPIIWPLPHDRSATIIVRDSSIRADLQGALGFTSPIITAFPPTVIVERTQVIGNGNAADTAYRFIMSLCHTRLKDVTVTGCVTMVDGYALLDNVVSAGAPGEGISGGDRLRNFYVNNVAVTNASLAALGLASVRHSFLGPDNLLEGCLYPVLVSSLLPGSVVPSTGNTFNHILARGGSQLESDHLWTDAGVPWGWDAPNYGMGDLTISPGVTVLMYPDMFLTNQGGRISAEGRPDAPILFTPLYPGQPWHAIVEAAPRGSRYDHCILEGSESFAIGVSEGIVHIDSSTISGNTLGLYTADAGTLKLRKTQLTANQTAVQGNSLNGVLNLSTPDAPNSIAGNGVGIYVPGLEQFLPVYDARNTWWGHPSGPTVPQNPGGQGDSIASDYNNLNTDIVQFNPFLTQSPDFTNHPPVVRTPTMPTPTNALLLETGQKVILRWTAEDDDQIVSQRILFSDFDDYDSLFVVVAGGLPPDQRSFEFTVPNLPLIFTSPFIRIEAIDSLGQIGWDHFQVFIPEGSLDDVELTITSDYGGTVVRAGTDLPLLTWTPVTNPFGLGANFTIQLDADEQAISIGGWFADRGYWSATRTPFASTDLARIAISIVDNGNNHKTFFGEYFSIRPDPLLGDAPPTVRLLSPQGGAFEGGGVIPISWTASDDESVRSFQIQASYDAGRTWHTIVKDLPGSAASYDWLLPPSTGIADVRVRVIARDLRFQSSSSTSDPFAILPGDNAPCPADFNGDSLISSSDITAFLAAWFSDLASGTLTADFNASGSTGSSDITAFLSAWFEALASGC
ncbi:MAG: hypothetical protein H7Y88_06840 [Phycisphaerales bacterium]|nr:hypothetical protein [Phycisphaerales bacterium]